MGEKVFKRTAVIIASIFAFVAISAVFVMISKDIKAETRNTVTILEIEPGNRFQLTEKKSGNKPSATSGIEQFNNTVNSKTIIVNHMTMSEFIGKVEQINGKYDVIVIGSYTGLSGENFAYSAPFNAIPDNMPSYIPFGKELTNGMRNDTVLSKDGKRYVEYYSENDITTKKANEIKEVLTSGQLVYMASDIFNVAGSKLVSNFNSLSYANLIKTANSNITVDDITKRYLGNLGNKPKQRPVLTINSKPVDNVGNLNLRNMNFNFNLSTENNNPVKVNLYMDLNGDGLFKDKELVKSLDVTPSAQFINSNIGYNLQDEFVGILTWKLEAVTQDNVKVYETGSLKYNAPANKKVNVRVLQITPNSGTNLDLTKDTGIKNLISNVNDYSITITSMTADAFNTSAGNTTKLNGNYDMVILGFADSYGSSDLTDNSINELKSFIATGQSVMFTHDTFTYRIYTNIDTNDQSAKRMTQAFRDIAGQSRYKDPFNASELDVYKQYNAATGTYVDRKITHDSSSDINKTTFGYSDGILKMYESNPKPSSFSGTSNSVYKINDGLVNQYPFGLGDIQVADTHYQWYQLNLEDPDVVPWYTLKPNGNGYNQYDPRNYFYIYSKGNITYSGAGHGDGYTNDEKSLFVNTMVEASRGANHAPTLTVKNLNDGDSFSKNQDSIKFTILPLDVDNDKLTTTVKVKDSTGAIIGQPIQFINKSQGTQLEVSLDSSTYNFKQLSSFSVEIETVDPLNAKVNRTINVRLVNDPTISLSYTSDKSGYLKGDTATVTLKATSNAGDANSEIDNIVFRPNAVQTDNYSLSTNDSSNVISFNNVTFSPKPNISDQSNNMSVTLKTEGSYSVDGTLSYDYKLQDGTFKTVTTNYSIPLVVKTGKINVSVVGDNNQVINISTDINVTSPNNVISSSVNLNGSIRTFDNLISGSYTFTITPPEGYGVVGQTTRSYELGYGNPVEDAAFKITRLPTLNVTFDKDTGYLKGDTANVRIGVEGVAQGSSQGKISDIKIDFSKADLSNVKFISSSTLTYDDISFTPTPQGSAQSRNLQLQLLSDDNITIAGELSYIVTVGGVANTITASYPLSFNVKPGQITVGIRVVDDATNTLDVPVNLTLKDGSGQTLVTKQLNAGSNGYTFNNSILSSDKYFSSGNYSVEVQCPTGYSVDSASNSVSLSYANSNPTINFTFRKNTAVFKHGRYLNNNIFEIQNSTIISESTIMLAIEVKIHDSAPNLQLRLDDGLATLNTSGFMSNGFKIYSVDESGNKTEINSSSYITQPDTNKPVYNITLGPVSETDKHYIVTYNIKLGNESSYTNIATLNGTPKSFIITCTGGSNGTNGTGGSNALPDLF